jgi:hypothetical protein
VNVSRCRGDRSRHEDTRACRPGVFEGPGSKS